MFRDLRESQRPRSPDDRHDRPFPYDTVPTGTPPGAAVIEPGLAQPLAVKAD